VAGAVITFAVDRTADGFDLQAIGWILMGGGALSLLVAMIRGAGFMSMRRSDLRTERHKSSDGQHNVEETHTS
jgi:hypothetical protein